MSVATISPQDASAAMSEDGSATYVDVRTVAEFSEGRPKGRAINLPFVFYHPKTGNEHPNEAFELVARHRLGASSEILIGADHSDRASRAAAALVAMGYTGVKLMDGGIDAWREAGLTVTGDNRDGVSYVSLLTPARRAKD